jgi:hypothetical protein
MKIRKITFNKIIAMTVFFYLSILRWELQIPQRKKSMPIFENQETCRNPKYQDLKINQDCSRFNR